MGEREGRKEGEAREGEQRIVGRRRVGTKTVLRLPMFYLLPVTSNHVNDN